MPYSCAGKKVLNTAYHAQACAQNRHDCHSVIFNNVLLTFFQRRLYHRRIRIRPCTGKFSPRFLTRISVVCILWSEADPSAYTQALYASIIGSNLGAFFTPLGALAGIMWTNLLKTSNVRMNFVRFTKYGTAVAIPSLTASLLVLSIV